MHLVISPPVKVRVPTTQEIDDGWTLPSESEVGRRPLVVTAVPEPQVAAASAEDGWPLDNEPDAGDPRMNLNTANLDQLCALPGIGVRKAESIIAHRERCGGLKSVVELDALHGFGPLLIGRLTDLCRTE